MKLEMNRRELAAAAKNAVQIASATSPLKVLECVLLELEPKQNSLMITSTNMEVTLKQHLPVRHAETDAPSVAVNARLFAAMLEKLDGETVTLTQEKENQIQLQSNRASYTVATLPGREFPRMEIPFPEDTVKVTKIPTMIKRTAFATSNNKETPLLNCLHLRFTDTGLRLDGSNGNCIITAMGDKQSTGNISFLVPATSMEKLSRLCGDKDSFSVGTTGKQLVFLKDGFAFSARLLEGHYVDTDRIMGSVKPAFTILTDANELRDAVISANMAGGDGRVSVVFHGGKISLHSSGSAGNAQVSLDVIPLTGNPSGEQAYSARSLSKSLQAISGAITLGVAQGGMLSIATEDVFYIQNAMRNKPATAKEAA